MNEDSLLLEPPENFLFSGKIEEDADGTLHVRRDLRLSTVSYYLLGFSPFVLSGASFLLGIFNPITFDIEGLIDVLARLILIGGMAASVFFLPVYEWWGILQAKKRGRTCLTLRPNGEVEFLDRDLRLHRDDQIVLQLVQDLTSEHVSLPEEHVKRLSGNQPYRQPIYMIELNYLTGADGERIRRPLFCAMQGSDLIELGKRLSSETGWPMRVEIGERLPGQLVNIELRELRHQQQGDHHNPSELDYTDDLSEDYRREKQERAQKYYQEHVTTTRETLQQNRFMFWLCSLMCLAGGTWALYTSVDCYQKIADSQSWPSTKGIVAAAKVVESGSGSDIEYTPEVEYAYSVLGKDYFSSRIEICPHNEDTRTAAEAVVENFPSGSHVEVYYDPTQPEFAVLVRGNREAPAFDRGMGFILILIGIISNPKLHDVVARLWPNKNSRSIGGASRWFS